MSNESAFAVLDSLYDELVRAATTGNSEHYASLFVENAVLMPPGAAVVSGREAVRDWIDRFLKEYDLQVDTFSIDDRAIGDAVAFCRWTSTGIYQRRDGGSIRYDQKYIDTFIKDTDGNWRFVIHMWSPNTKDLGVWADYI